VVGKLPVWKLYADGVPQQIMRMLRDGRHGGVGRLEETRREIVTKAGELVPVNMTASIIYEDDVEVATVGIFSDLRERIRIEQRLLKAQEDLEHSEKNALVAQLAGTAAHELNQPLTSIMGYAQLVARQLEGEAAGARAVDIILREAERMAEIVRKIGRITQFETKEYVGSASIIDLDKSAPAPPQFGAPIEKSAEAVPEPMPIEDTRPNPTGSASEAGSPVVQAPVVDESSRRTMKVSRLVVEQGEEVSTQKRTLKIPRLDKDGNPIR
jgi:signal transduction histidine kinase